MKWLLSVLLVFANLAAFAQDKVEDTGDQFEIQQKEDHFTETEVGQALETTESTLDQIGREIASGDEIEVVE